MEKKIPYAVVLDISFGGYGIVRSLARYGIPVIGLKSNQFVPEQGTRLCKKIYTYKNYGNLLYLLTKLAKSLESKPLLYLTADKHVFFFHDKRNELMDLYDIRFPEESIIKLLIDKLKFYEYAEKNQILTPKTMNLREVKNFDVVKNNLNYPIILKPWLRTNAWSNNIKGKAFLIDDFSKFQSIYDKVAKFEKNLLVQEYIPGGDENIHYCLTYFNEKSVCLGAFTGQKVRQWPIQTGSTATTIPTTNDFVKNETIRIFESVGYKGFGSIEYKKHDVTGKYYVIEPTVGRINQQEYITTLNNMNLPVIAYSEITGMYVERGFGISKKVIYIDEVSELKSVFKYIRRGELTLYRWLKSLRGKRAYRFSTFADPFVSLYALIYLFRAWFKPG